MPRHGHGRNRSPAWIKKTPSSLRSRPRSESRNQPSAAGRSAQGLRPTSFPARSTCRSWPEWTGAWPPSSASVRSPPATGRTTPGEPADTEHGQLPFVAPGRERAQITGVADPGRAGVPGQEPGHRHRLSSPTLSTTTTSIARISDISTPPSAIRPDVGRTLRSPPRPDVASVPERTAGAVTACPPLPKRHLDRPPQAFAKAGGLYLSPRRNFPFAARTTDPSALGFDMFPRELRQAPDPDSRQLEVRRHIPHRLCLPEHPQYRRYTSSQ